MQPVTPTVNYLKTKSSISTTAKGSLFVCRIPSCPTHANKMHCPLKPPWAQMHADPSEEHPWAKLCGSYLALMECPCTQHVPRTHKFVSFPTRPASSLLLTLGSIKSSNKVTEARLLWSLSHCRFLSCLQVYRDFRFQSQLPEHIKIFLPPCTSPLQGQMEPWRAEAHLLIQSIVFPLPSVFPLPPASAYFVASFFGRTQILP